MLRRHLNRAEGFTLIELLIVVAIIAILAAIAVPNFLEAQTRAKVSRSYADMRSVGTAMEAYHIDWNRYVPHHFPGSTMFVWGIAATGANGAPSIGANLMTINPRIWRLLPLTTPTSYITNIPRDVFNRDLDQDQRYWRSSERVSYQEHSTDDIYDEFYFELFPSVRWVFRAVGPSDGNINAPFDLDDLYDPTNGTISVGNIVFAGPGESVVGD